jgi:prepilin-type N-terminal cleavage/methylation domain-containing protein
MRPRAFSRQDGFTLVELMVAMSIFLLILVGIFQVFDPSRNAYQVSTRKLDVQQNARVAMDRMARQLRMTGYFPENLVPNPVNPLSNSIQVATDSAISVAGDLDEVGTSSAYTFCFNSGLRRVSGTIGAAGSYTCAGGQLMAESVTALSFAYFDSANNPVPSPPGAPFNLDAQGLGAAPSFASVAQRSIVRRIVITVTAQENVPSQGTQTYTLTSDVRIRNP